MKMNITSALDRFKDKYEGKTFMAIPFLAGLVVSVTVPTAYQHFTSLDGTDTVVSEAISKADDPAALKSAVGDGKSIAAELAKNEERRTALLAASAALNRMTIARNPNSSDYAEGAEGAAQREADFNAAKLDYEDAIIDAQLDGLDLSPDDLDAGPNTSFKINELEFSLDALEAIGADVDMARTRGRFQP